MVCTLLVRTVNQKKKTYKHKSSGFLLLMNSYLIFLYPTIIGTENGGILGYLKKMEDDLHRFLHYNSY